MSAATGPTAPTRVPSSVPPSFPPPPERSRRGALTLVLLAALAVASFVSLDLQWAALFETGSAGRLAEFASGFVPPSGEAAFLLRLRDAAFETLAMSAVGTGLAALLGAALALPAACPPRHASDVFVRSGARLVLNALRSVPELVWAAMWLIAAGLGPLPGTLALAAHTTGVLGRLFADTLENLPEAPARALADNGAAPASVFLYATLPQALPQWLSYGLYRWENNIRAAAVLGVVGAGGLGQMLHFHMSLFQMREAASVILAMMAIVGIVDLCSWWARRRLAS